MKPTFNHWPKDLGVRSMRLRAWEEEIKIRRRMQRACRTRGQRRRDARARVAAFVAALGVSR